MTPVTIPNWSSEVIVYFIFLIPMAVGAGFIAWQYMKTRQLYLLYFTWCSTLVFIIVFLEALSYLFLDPFIFYIRYYIIVIYIFTFILAVDSISRDSVDPVKIVVVTGIAVYTFTYMSVPDIQKIQFSNLQWTLTVALTLPTLLTIIMQGAFTFLFFVFSVQIHQKAPKRIKHYSLMGMVGGFFGGPLLIVILAFRLTMIIPGIAAIAESTGVLFIALSFGLKPQLAYILPSKAMRIVTIDTSGIALFNHSWTTQTGISDEMLFSGALQGISEILKVTVHRGNVREIVFDNAAMIINYSPDYLIACVLLVTKATKTLRHALDRFSAKFYVQFLPYLDKVVNLENFTPAQELVKDYFGFLPDFTGG